MCAVGKENALEERRHRVFSEIHPVALLLSYALCMFVCTSLATGAEPSAKTEIFEGKPVSDEYDKWADTRQVFLSDRFWRVRRYALLPDGTAFILGEGKDKKYEDESRMDLVMLSPSGQGEECGLTVVAYPIYGEGLAFGDLSFAVLLRNANKERICVITRYVKGDIGRTSNKSQTYIDILCYSSSASQFILAQREKIGCTNVDYGKHLGEEMYNFVEAVESDVERKSAGPAIKSTDEILLADINNDLASDLIVWKKMYRARPCTEPGAMYEEFKEELVTFAYDSVSHCFDERNVVEDPSTVSEAIESGRPLFQNR